MKISLLVIYSILLSTENSEGVDFSQFYLPPCCYTQDTFSGYASPSDKIMVTSKREALMSQGSLTNEEYGFNNYTQTQQPKKDATLIGGTIKEKIRLYSLTIPIRDIIVAKKAKKLEEQLASELSMLTVKKKIIFPRDTESQMVEKYEQWEPKKLERIQEYRTGLLNTRNEISMQDSASEAIPQKITRKIPSSWIKYLRRALYQSITEGKGITSETGTESYNRDNEKQQRKGRSKIQYPEMWKSLKAAQLQYVDKMSQVSTTPYGSIYLPLDEGPVVSGVLVNSHNGNLHLRVASELYYPGTSAGYEEHCRCYLMGPGEILVAYWSVSRIFKENGQPALQYLVYPLPHSVPTPPEFFPFSNSNENLFLPSPIDPLSNYYENVHKHKTVENAITESYLGSQKHLEVQSQGHSIRMRHPKLVEELPNPLQIGVPGEGIPPNAYPIPTGLPLGQESPPPPPPHPLGHYYSPELAQQYQFAVQNYIAHQMQNERNSIYHTIPYADLNINGPLNYELPFQGIPSVQPPIQPILSTINPPLELSHPNQPIPVNTPPPTDPPVSDVQLQQPQNFPNSIQDIISPVALNNDEVLPPLPVPQLQQQGQGPVIEHPIPVPHMMEFPYPPNINNYYPHHPQFFNANPLNFNQNQGIFKQNSQSKVKNEKNKQDNNNTVNQITDNDRIEQKPNKEDQNSSVSPDIQRPNMVSNILDNEKRYYPIRQPPKNHIRYHHDKYDSEKDKKVHMQRFVQDINNKGGYILDF